MKRTLLVVLIIGAAIVGFAFVVRNTQDVATRNKHKVDQLTQIITNQQEELMILRNATDPRKVAAAYQAFFRRFDAELGALKIAVQQTSRTIRTVVVTRTRTIVICERPNGRPC